MVDVDYFAIAKETTRDLYPCANHKDLTTCRHCKVPCDPRNLTYQSSALCEECQTDSFTKGDYYAGY